MASGLYDKAKFVAQILLPALATLYVAMAGIWGFDGTTPVVATITALDTFLGVVLQISSKSYQNSDTKYDGVANVLTDEDGTKTFQLDISSNPDALETLNEILFKVNRINE